MIAVELERTWKDWLGIWWQAARPKTLWAGAVPVFLGYAAAWLEGLAHLPSVAVALVCVLLIQVGTNVANDYFDFVNGADTAERQGPVRVTQAGLCKPTQVRAAFVAIFALAALAGIYLVWRGGWSILVLGLVSLSLGVLYTGGPRPLGYLGWGDVLVFLFFGPLAVAGTYAVQTGHWSGMSLLLGVVPGSLSTALLVVNNLRDRRTDAKAGKRTLAVRWGRSAMLIEYGLCIAVAVVIPALGAMWGLWPMGALLGALVVIPGGFVLRELARADSGFAYNRCLGQTARLLVNFCVLFMVGITIWR